MMGREGRGRVMHNKREEDKQTVDMHTTLPLNSTLTLPSPR